MSIYKLLQTGALTILKLKVFTLEGIKPVAADAQEWVPAAAECFLVEGDTVGKDKCHFELTSAALGQEHLVLKAEEASQASGSVAVVVE